MKKKKKSHSLVRKLSLNKFRTPVEQSEQRRTPEGGDSSRSLSRSSPDSQSHSDLVSKHSDDFIEQPKKDEHIEQLKIASTVTVIPQKSPQLTLKSTSKDKKGKWNFSFLFKSNLHICLQFFLMKSDVF